MGVRSVSCGTLYQKSGWQFHFASHYHQLELGYRYKWTDSFKYCFFYYSSGWDVCHEFFFVIPLGAWFDWGDAAQRVGTFKPAQKGIEPPWIAAAMQRWGC